MQKPKRKIFVSETFLAQKVFRPLAQELMLIIWNTQITPNMISIFRMVCMLPLGLLLIHNTVGSLALSVALFFFMEILDHLDGMLARAKGLSSKRGQIIEVLSDDLTSNPTFILGLLIVLNGKSEYILISFLICMISERCFYFLNYNLPMGQSELKEKDHDNEAAYDFEWSIKSVVVASLRALFIWKPIVLLFLNLLLLLYAKQIYLIGYFGFIAAVYCYFSMKHVKKVWNFN